MNESGQELSSSGSAILPEWDQLASLVGDFIQYWGFKNVHGRIWTHLYLSKTPLDALEIRKRLKISKALVSLSVHDLMHYNVIKEVGKSPRGTILYTANSDLHEAIFNVLRTREERMVARIQGACRLLQAVPDTDRSAVGIDADRLNMMSEIITSAKDSLDLFLNGQGLTEMSLCHLLSVKKDGSSGRQID